VSVPSSVESTAWLGFGPVCSIPADDVPTLLNSDRSGMRALVGYSGAEVG